MTIEVYLQSIAVVGQSESELQEVKQRDKAWIWCFLLMMMTMMMMTLIVDDGGACWKDGYDDVDDGDDDAYKCEVFDQTDHVGAVDK